MAKSKDKLKISENKKNLKMVVPTIKRDVAKLLQNIDLFFEYLPISKIYVIGTYDVKEALPQEDRISFVEESQLSDFSKIKKAIIERTGNESDGNRAGWYVQQFIKMGFSRCCNDEFYLLWDSDTVPVRDISMFQDGVPFFDCKTEFHKPYFDTMERLVPGLSKQRDKSFISEHMLIKTDYMKKLLDVIESNESIIGNDFQEKIINAVDIAHLSKSGFSEFETYGNYVVSEFPESYMIRNWKSMRFGGFFFENGQALNDSLLSWLAQKYDAISFEKGHEISCFSQLVSKQMFQKICSPTVLEAFAFGVRGIRKVF